MSYAGVSTSYLSSALLPSVTQAQSALATAALEASSGQYADLGLQLGDQAGFELSLRNQTGQLQTLTASNALASTSLSVAQAALEAIRASAQTALGSLAALPSTGTSSGSLQAIGDGSLQSMISAANTTSNNQYVFAGEAVGAAPMKDYYSPATPGAKTAIFQAFQTTFGFAPSDPAASAISGPAMQSFLNGPIAAQFQGTGWADGWSSASSVNTSQSISPGRTITTSANLNQPGFQNLAQAYAMLSAFGGANFSASASQALVSTASTLMSAGIAGITKVQAGLGEAQQQVSDASASMTSQLTIIQTQINSLDNVDPNATAIRINSLTTQLQTSYDLISRLHSMSLAQYLPIA